MIKSCKNPQKTVYTLFLWQWRWWF